MLFIIFVGRIRGQDNTDMAWSRYKRQERRGKKWTKKTKKKKRMKEKKEKLIFFLKKSLALCPNAPREAALPLRDGVSVCMWFPAARRRSFQPSMCYVSDAG